MKPKFLIVGHGGRESVFADRLGVDTHLYAVMGHKNHSIIQHVESSGGQYMVGDTSDPRTITDFAAKCKIDYAFINSDEPLANGVVDSLLKAGFKAVGGTQAATRIEWDKEYSIRLMEKLCPEFTPYFQVINNVEEIDAAISVFETRRISIVVKPQGLTGGKGVKVMPEHLQTYNDCKKYIVELLKNRPNETVILVERLYGIEFTIMGITDGSTLVMSPATYDYPFREEGDKGPGTGGMGCFTAGDDKLPFMTDGDMKDCQGIMEQILDELRQNGTPLQGVINGGFFKTADGIKFMEFNSRFGDPEVLNILSILDGSFSELITSLWNRTLSKVNVEFSPKASVVKYLVAHEYPGESPESTIFEINEKAVNDMGVSLHLASCIKRDDGRYETLKKSRVAAFTTKAEKIEDASSLIDDAIRQHVQGDLEWRTDIGSRDSLEDLERSASHMNS